MAGCAHLPDDIRLWQEDEVLRRGRIKAARGRLDRGEAELPALSDRAGCDGDVRKPIAISSWRRRAREVIGLQLR
ncbi:hypothetical protein KCP73_08470 [Salmonella enterica subsp. enterica]|nr:hypothetical protein KCP73_08470 [Salmonella enterica subsp. enterica]